mgnify:CR=1 FL=1
MDLEIVSGSESMGTTVITGNLAPNYPIPNSRGGGTGRSAQARRSPIGSPIDPAGAVSKDWDCGEDGTGGVAADEADGVVAAINLT